MYMYVYFQGIKSGIWSFISTTLGHVLFVPQKMQETLFYVHKCDAQKHL